MGGCGNVSTIREKDSPPKVRRWRVIAYLGLLVVWLAFHWGLRWTSPGLLWPWSFHALWAAFSLVAAAEGVMEWRLYRQTRAWLRSGELYCWRCEYRIDNVHAETEFCPECGFDRRFSILLWRNWKPWRFTFVQRMDCRRLGVPCLDEERGLVVSLPAGQQDACGDCCVALPPSLCSGFTTDLPLWKRILLESRIPVAFGLISYMVTGGFWPWPVLLMLAIPIYAGRDSYLGVAHPIRRILDACRSDDLFPSTGRLICFGDCRELEPLRDIKDESFEPVAFRVSRVPVSVATCSIVVVGSLVLAYTMWVYPLSRVGVMSAVVLACSWVVAVRLLLVDCWRISPGRLDVYRTRILQSKRTPVASVDLSSARIICRFDEGEVRIAAGTPLEDADANQEGKNPTKNLTLALGDVDRPHDCVRWLFKGAISTQIGHGPLKISTMNSD